MSKYEFKNFDWKENAEHAQSDLAKKSDFPQLKEDDNHPADFPQLNDASNYYDRFKVYTVEEVPQIIEEPIVEAPKVIEEKIEEPVVEVPKETRKKTETKKVEIKKEKTDEE